MLGAWRAKHQRSSKNLEANDERRRVRSQSHSLSTDESRFDTFSRRAHKRHGDPALLSHLDVKHTNIKADWRVHILADRLHQLGDLNDAISNGFGHYQPIWRRRKAEFKSLILGNDAERLRASHSSVA